MNSFKLIFALIILPTYCFADWQGDLLCVKPSHGEHKLVADAKGRVSVKVSQGVVVSEVKLESLRLFSDFGATRGSVTSLSLSGEVSSGNDKWFAEVSPLKDPTNIRKMYLDLSPNQKALSYVKTFKGNVYKMDCFVRED